MKLAVLISGGGTNLQSFIDASAAGELGADIALVISNRADAYGLERARKAGIDTAVVDHRAFEDRESFDKALLDALAPTGVDLVILAGFMRILTPVFIAPYLGRLLNIHPSLLPLYPGLKTHQRALDAGDAEVGATVHFVTEELDGGPPVIQARVPVEAGDDAETLAARVLQVEHRIYPLAARWFAEGRLTLAGNRALLDGEPLPASGWEYRA
jgi:phosphoribosylglycinamide formyltransferase-1